MGSDTSVWCALPTTLAKYVWARRKEDGPVIKMKKAPSKPRHWCAKCEVHLCVGKCFERYHKGSIEHLDHGRTKARRVPVGNVGVGSNSDEDI